MVKRRPIKDRLKNVHTARGKSTASLNMAESMRQRLPNSEKIDCTIDQHFRTRIFDFPGALAKEKVPQHTIYESQSVRAVLVCDLKGYLKESNNRHYAISPSLRYAVDEMLGDSKASNSGMSLYLVVEEVDKLVPVVLNRECALSDEVTYRDGKRTPMLKGGRDNERFIVAFETSDGEWPDIPSHVQMVNMVLAAVRALQDAHDEIRKHVDQSCLVTDDGRFVLPFPGPSASFRAGTVSLLDAEALRDEASRAKSAILRIERELSIEHIELLVNALYWDDYNSDEFRRLHYLNLWQSLYESRKKLGYVSPDPRCDLKYDKTIVAGYRSLAELTEYRDEVAHCWTGSMDGNLLADIYRTINELVRRKYFT